MPVQHRRNAKARGTRLEARVAKALGTRRVHRSRYQSAPDLEVVRAPCGLELIIECKHRRTLPALIKSALVQAASYAPDAVPVAVLQAFGEQAVAVITLDDFRRLVGLKKVSANSQPSLFAKVVE